MALTNKTGLSGLNMGDYLWCKYSSAGKLGAFFDLGTKTDADVGSNIINPASPTSTPNGYFKFIFTGYDALGRMKFVADRVLQTGTWQMTLYYEGVGSANGIPMYMGLIKEFTTATPPTGYTVTTSAEIGGYEGWKLFNKGISGWLASTASPNPSVTLDMGANTKFDMYSIIPQASGAGGSYVTAWTIFGSNDGDNWNTIDSKTGMVFTSQELDKRMYYKLASQVNYRYLKIEINATSGSWNTIGEFDIYLTTSNYKYNFRFPTGGHTANDVNCEWYQIIQNSTLGGTITAGDTSAWNLNNIHNMTSTSDPNNSYQTVYRGANTVSNFYTDTDQTGSPTMGWRPVMVVEPINRYLIQSGDNIYKIFNGAVTQVGTRLVSNAELEQLFLNHGMLSLGSLTSEISSQLGVYKILYYI